MQEARSKSSSFIKLSIVSLILFYLHIQYFGFTVFNTFPTSYLDYFFRIFSFKGYLKNDDEGVVSLSVDSSSQQLASTNHNGSVTIWDLKKGEFEYVVKPENSHPYKYLSVLLISKHNRLVLGGRSGKLSFWDLSKKRSDQVANASNGSIRLLSSSHDENKIASIDEISTEMLRAGESTSNFLQKIKIWDAKTAKMICSEELDKYEKIGGLIFVNDAQGFAFYAVEKSTQKNQVIFVDSHTCNFKAKINVKSSTRSIAWNKENKSLFRATLEGIFSHDLNSGKVLKSFNTPNSKANLILLSSSGKTLISSHEENRLKVWDTETSKVSHSLRGLTSPPRLMLLSEDSEDSSTILTTGIDEGVGVWQLKLK